MSEEAMPVDPCTRAEQLMPEYWQGELNPENRVWLEQHMQACTVCAELADFWRQLGQLPEAKPDPQQRRRFDAMLAAHKTDRWYLALHEGWPSNYLRPLPVALSLALLLAGFGGGWWLRGNSSRAAQDQASEIAALREEVHATSQLVVLSMLQQQSANDRLQGVSYSRHLSQPDSQIVQALLHALQYDRSPDVRLAALDALQNANPGGKTDPTVTRGLVEAFPYQSSPLVQVALVDSFLELRLPAARALLQKISADPAYSPEVRQRAAWGLSQWN